MQLVPYIMFNGRCEEALNFYKTAFDGAIKDLLRYEGSPVESATKDKHKVMNAVFEAKGVLFMAADTAEDHPEKVGVSNVHLSINFEDSETEEKVFRALSEGAKITMPLQDTFWGARFGMLTDKFGIHWMFNYDKPKGQEQ